ENDRDNLAPFLPAESRKIHLAPYRSVVNEDVQPSELLHSGCNQSVALLGVGNIGEMNDSFAASAADSACGFFRQGGGGLCVNNHRGASAAKGNRYRATDVLRCAGDNGDPAFKFTIHASALASFGSTPVEGSEVSSSKGRSGRI